MLNLAVHLAKIHLTGAAGNPDRHLGVKGISLGRLLSCAIFFKIKDVNRKTSRIDDLVFPHSVSAIELPFSPQIIFRI